ncbi:hypothetical protein [Aeromicrobium sp. 179-A 4D2 NHS]|uniref:hypothetical protein n=1 Tax=Aeromicrobium sp. 179-A 4D2 NHS TaxID=3142375 RepID=UPI0039A29EE0
MSRPAKTPVVVPAGLDVTIEAGRVRRGMWVMGPGMDEFALVRSFTDKRYGCHWGPDAGRPPRSVVSFRRFGQREFSPDEPVAVRVPVPFDPAVVDLWGAQTSGALFDAAGMLTDA